jgi:predicted NBD/HSP70 family sugar kinase
VDSGLDPDGDRSLGAPSLRRHNLALLMRLICRDAPVSRVELAHRTGLTKATVSVLVGELVKALLVVDLGAGPGNAPGRPAGRLAPGPLGPVGIGLQLDVDHVAGCVVDLGGRPRAREIRRISAEGLSPGALIRAARPVLGRLFDQAVSSGRLVTGVGVAVPAVMERDVDGDPVVSWGPGLSWRGLDVRQLVAAELAALGATGVDVVADNDVAFAALAEPASESGRERCEVYVGGESEIGAAVRVGGRLRRWPSVGGSGFAHLPVRRRGPRCRCGGRGCLDLYAGRSAMLAAAGAPSDLESRLAGRRLRGEWSGVGPHALRAAARAAAALGDALLPVVAALDPDTVVIGGWLGSIGPALLGPLRERMMLPVHGPGRVWPIRVATIGADAAMRGAASRVLAPVHTDPAGWIQENAAP